MIKEEEKFRVIGNILDDEMESFLIHLSENDDTDDSCDEM